MMSTSLVVLSLVGAAGVPYFAFSTFERYRRRRAAAVHQASEALGDEAYPTTLHPEIDLDACIGSGACVRACPERDVIAITDGRVRLINPLACVGHGACLSACPVDAIRLVFGTATRGVELPRLSPTFETSQPGVYVTGELGGMGLIRNSIEQGRQAAAAIASSGRRHPELDAIVVGAGPAGLGTALGLQASGLRTLIVEQDLYGGTIAHYPRGKVVMTGNLELPGYGTVRRKTMSKEQLLDLWGNIRARTGIAVDEGVRVESLEREGNGWRVVGANGWERRAANVVLALGKRGAPNRLGVPGEELAKVSYRVIEPEAFAGKRVLVVGGGNAAADCVIALAEQGGCKTLALSYRRTELSRMRGPLRTKIERMFKTGAIVPHLGTEVVEIGARYVVLRAHNSDFRLANDAVVIQIGGRPPSELLKSIGIALVEKRGEA